MIWPNEAETPHQQSYNNNASWKVVTYSHAWFNHMPDLIPSDSSQQDVPDGRIISHFEAKKITFFQRCLLPDWNNRPSTSQLGTIIRQFRPTAAVTVPLGAIHEVVFVKYTQYVQKNNKNLK